MKKRTGVSPVLPLMLAVLLCVSGALTRLDRNRQAEGRRTLEQAIRRTAVTCYGAEGFYPPDVAYMQNHYGLRYDEDTYVVHYRIFASNLMPDITVLEK